MLPLGLKVLLGEAKNPPVSKVSQSKRRATIADWLEFNGLSREAVLRQLALIEPLYGYALDISEAQSYLGLSADKAWALCAEAMRAAFPGLKPEIDQIEAGAPKCLKRKSIKHPEPFTYDLGFQKLPFVSLHYRGLAKDLLMMAHEFGHAVQIVASWQCGEGQMPPIARECCAFIAELALLGAWTKNPGVLLAGYRADSAVYFGANRGALLDALENISPPYRYEWNYPLARIMAAHLWEDKDREGMSELFRAGRNGGAVFTQKMASAELEAA